MPEDERSPGAPDLTPDLDEAQWLELLAVGSLEVRGRMPWSSNGTFLVAVDAGDVGAQAIYKPEQGERPLWDFPEGIYRREVAAYELSRALGFGVVPETIVRDDAPFGTGSLQRFVDADFAEHYFTLLGVPEHDPALRRIAAFDLLANNADRKGGHLLKDQRGHIWGIDNGLCFHEDDKLRTVMWDYAGEQVPDEAVAAARTLVASLPEVLTELLDPRECDALVERADRLVESPYFPFPGGRRSHPWPLV